MASKETAGWSEGLLKELQPIRRLTDATEGVYNKARSLFMDVKAKFNKAEDTIAMDKALSVLRDDLHFPEERAINFLCRLKKQEAACSPNSDQLNAANFGQFIRKITEIKQEIIPAFSEYDADHNGLISLQEATAILGRPPFNFPQARVDSLLKRFDRDNNGQLDIEEFAAFYAEARISHEEVSACFDRLDRDGNGVLSPDEVLNVIQEQMGYDQATAESLIKIYDKNQDGNLDRTEFMFLWSAMFGQ